MREDKKTEDIEDKSTNDKKKLVANIPLSEWYDIERRMAIVSRMSTEPAKNPPKNVSSSIDTAGDSGV
ncbi:MAG: hypothetical protein ACE5H4_15060 [Candidatus Thorarchaeota archaeon]